MKLKGGLLGLGLIASGCATVTQNYEPGREPEMMTQRETPFYQHGPAQPGRPEMLPPQTFVALSREESGFSRVRLSDGRFGYLPTEDLRVAPPSARPVATEELFPPTVDDLALNLPEPDLTLPVADLPVGPAE
jgi:hypothetical protein